MFKIGELIAFRPDLLLGTKYGTVTYTPTLSEYKNDILRVVRITTAGTACCQVYKTPSTFYKKGKEVSTIHELMVVKPMFNVTDSVYITDNYLKFLVGANQITQAMAENLIGTKVEIIDIDYFKESGFEYKVSKIIPGVLHYKSEYIPEKCLLNEYESLNDYEYENRLQEQKVADSGGESYEGCGVHGESLQSKISIGCLGDSKGIRGS
jgi:hypothetical protein